MSVRHSLHCATTTPPLLYSGSSDVAPPFTLLFRGCEKSKRKEWAKEHEEHGLASAWGCDRFSIISGMQEKRGVVRARREENRQTEKPTQHTERKTQAKAKSGSRSKSQSRKATSKGTSKSKTRRNTSKNTNRTRHQQHRQKENSAK